MHCYVFFDVDDTFLQWLVTWQEAFLQAAAEAGVSLTWERASEKLGEALRGYYHDCLVRHCASGAPDLQEFWLDYDGRILQAMGVRHDVRHYAGRVIELLSDPRAVCLYPEAPEVLHALHSRGAKLGIITGRPLAAPDLERLGILHYFDPVIDAFGARSTKDEPYMFHLAAEHAARAGLPAWHVGDSYTGDVLGARAAGLQPVLIDRTASPNGPDSPRITNLRALLPLLG